MAKELICAACGNRGKTPIDDSSTFELRGKFGGRPVIKCRKCGAGLFVRIFGRPKLIDADLWKRMEEIWERRFGGS